MQHTPPTPRDVEHVRLLSIFHYVVAGIEALWGCLPIIHVCIGMAILTGHLPADEGHGGPPRAFGMIFVVMGLAAIAMLWTLAVLALIAAKFLRAHRRRRFCIVVAAILCTQVPIGAVLGVFTLIVLTRPGVRALFADVPAALPPAAAPPPYRSPGHEA